MARRTVQPKPMEPKRCNLVVPLAEARRLVEERILEGQKLKATNISTPEDLHQAKQKMYRWADYNMELLGRIADTNELVNSYERQVFFASLGGTSFAGELQGFHSDMDHDINRLMSINERLQLIPVSLPSMPANMPPQQEAEVSTNTVFIVHGHDEAAKEGAARLIERLHLTAVILHERPDRGRTIIEKLEAHAEEAAYAVILLTPDDIGGGDSESLNPRARQNVIMELGFFIGKLGRKKVCALLKGTIEQPSDLSGVLYVPMDDGASWQLRLALEMKTAGLPVNLNDLAS